MVQGSNTSRVKRFFSSPKHPDQLWGPLSFLFIGYWGSFMGVKLQGHEVNHPHPSSAKVKSAWSYTTTPLICLRGAERENFTITLCQTFYYCSIWKTGGPYFIAIKYSGGKAMANYPQELAQDAVCQSYTGHMTGLWFLPTRPLRLNTNEWMKTFWWGLCMKVYLITEINKDAT